MDVLSGSVERRVRAGRPAGVANAEIIAFFPCRPHVLRPARRRAGGVLAPGDPGAARAAEDHLVAAFLDGRSRATAACYRRDLGHLREGLAHDGIGLLGATRADYGRLVQVAEANGVASATIRRRLAAASSFYRAAIAEGRLAASPVEGVRRPRGASAPRLGPDEDALRRLWSAACRRGGRAQLLVALLLVAGLRVSEAVGIDAAHVHDDAGRQYAEVVRKGGRPGLVALVPPLGDLVAAAVARQGPGPLLRGARGGRLGRQRAWEIVRALGEEAGLVGLGPHALRHAHVTAALREGVGIVAVQASAGHADPRLTVRYAQALLVLRGEAGAAVARQLGDVAGHV